MPRKEKITADQCRDTRLCEKIARQNGGEFRTTGSSHLVVTDPVTGKSSVLVMGHGKEQSNGVAKSFWIFAKTVGWISIFLLSLQFFPAAAGIFWKVAFFITWLISPETAGIFDWGFDPSQLLLAIFPEGVPQ